MEEGSNNFEEMSSKYAHLSYKQHRTVTEKVQRSGKSVKLSLPECYHKYGKPVRTAVMRLVFRLQTLLANSIILC